MNALTPRMATIVQARVLPHVRFVAGLWTLFVCLIVGPALPLNGQSITDLKSQLNDHLLPGHLWVQFKASLPAKLGSRTGFAEFDRAAAAYGIYAIENAFPIINSATGHRVSPESVAELQRVFVVRYYGPFNPLVVSAALARDHNVVYAEPQYVSYVEWDSFIALKDLSRSISFRPTAPNDPYFKDAGYMKRLEMTLAWDLAKGETADVIVAVVDAGTDWLHEDLYGNVWTNPGEIPANGIDDDANGYVDDVNGWNFANDSPDPAALPVSQELAEHGTLTAGAALAVTDNALGIAGTSWNAQLMPINAGCHDGGAICHDLESILYAAINGADIINASFTTRIYSQTAAMAYLAAHEAGALVVAAAGNSGVNLDHDPRYPASYPFTLSVGGTVEDSDANRFSYGRSVDVLAGSEGILSTLPNSEYGAADGTSFSTPLVSGIAALVKTIYPNFSPDQIREQIRFTADSIDRLYAPSFHGLFGRGRANAFRAVSEMDFPAVRVLGTEVHDNNADGLIHRGESVSVTATYRNFLADAASVIAKIETTSPYVAFTIAELNLGAVVSGESRSLTFSFDIAEDVPYRHSLELILSASTDVNSDATGILRLEANPAQIVTHDSGALQVSLTSEGNIGYLDFSDRRGNGFVALDATGTPRQLLFQGGLVVATSPESLSDCITLGRSEGTLKEITDFVPTSNAVFSITSPGEFTKEESVISMIDSAARNPIGIEITQHGLTDTGISHEDFIVLKYTVANSTQDVVDNLHFGLYLDWGTGRTAVTHDFARLYGSHDVLVQQNSVSDPTMIVGTRVLTRGSPLHMQAVDLGRTIAFLVRDELKWLALSDGIKFPSSNASDWGLLTGTGPISLQPNESVELAFALIAGKSKADFLHNADNAQHLWDTRIDPVARVRLIHSVADAIVDVYIDGQLYLDDWAFGSASAFDSFEEGKYDFDFVDHADFDNTSPFASSTIALEVGQAYDILMFGSEREIANTVVEGVITVRNSNPTVDVYALNGASGIGQIDLRLLDPQNANNVVGYIGKDIGYGDVSAYTSIDPMNYIVEVYSHSTLDIVSRFEVDLRHVAYQSIALYIYGSSGDMGIWGISMDGNVFLPPQVTLRENVDEAIGVLLLQPAYPNPTSSETRVTISLPSAANVSVDIYDILGRRQLYLPAKQFAAGSSHALEIDTRGLAPGSYLYRVHVAMDDRLETFDGSFVKVW